MILLLLAVQIVLLFWGFFRLGEYVVYSASLTVSFLVALVVVNRPGNPAAKITWIMLIMLAPVFATPFYFYVNMDIGYITRTSTPCRAFRSSTSRMRPHI